VRTRTYLLVAAILAVVALVVLAFFSVPLRVMSDSQRLREDMTLSEVERVLGPGTPIVGVPFPEAPPGFLPGDQFYRWRREQRLAGFVYRRWVIHVGLQNGRVKSVTCGGDP
jgi:hypothetical protein